MELEWVNHQNEKIIIIIIIILSHFPVNYSSLSLVISITDMTIMAVDVSVILQWQVFWPESCILITHMGTHFLLKITEYSTQFISGTKRGGETQGASREFFEPFALWDYIPFQLGSIFYVKWVGEARCAGQTRSENLLIDEASSTQSLNDWLLTQGLREVVGRKRYRCTL